MHFNAGDAVRHDARSLLGELDHVVLLRPALSCASATHNHVVRALLVEDAVEWRITAGGQTQQTPSESRSGKR